MRTVLEEVKSWHRPLMLMVLAMAGLVLTAGVGLLVDHREILNESVWLKPFKFGISFVIYGATLAWLLSKLRKARRLGWLTGTVFALTGIVDVGFIAIQGARGTFSHFNTNTDTFNQVGQKIFASGVFGLFGASLVVAIMLLFQRIGDAPLNRAIRTGIALATAGMALAFYLVGANQDKYQVSDASGHPVTLAGSHGIGVEPGGPGMPLTNWSTVGGDLRIPHFVGLHAIQVLLFTVLALSLLAARVEWLRPERVRTRLVGVAAFGYTGLMVTVTVQAFRGQSLIHPDGQTWTMLGGFTALTLAALALVVATARRQAPVPTERVETRRPVGV
ncbi:hypothetical protein [Kribbella solani]|uniref:Membrane protein implicated in regulation of membrane protease activity n=1 Tax=Kribbella solani TaxID=236067 RepID=A0A841DSV7_9ACTN|nr:hypothetical protein [Kribbella solani]MBB5981011.1 membrane protein implicated in regulation of membrane protease activity [Kribbella solani]